MKTRPEGFLAVAKTMLIAFVALGTLRFSSPASALQLVWSTGEANLTVTASQPCTLLVKAALGEELPTRWFLNWAGNVDVGAFLLPREPAPSQDVADICQATDTSTFEDRATHRRVVQHCVAGAERVKAARYILSADENTRVRVELVIESAPEIGTPGSVLEVAAEANVNGGRGLAYRPLISSVRWTEATSSLMVSGLHLDAVRRATCLPVGAAAAFPVAAEAQLDGTLLLADLPARSIGGSLRVFDETELVALADFSADTTQVPQPAPPEPVIAWFTPRSVRGNPLLPAAPLAGYAFEPPTLEDELGSAGVVALERLFPTFAANPPKPLNSAGEPVTYTDLGDMYVLHFDVRADTATAIGRLSSSQQVWYCARQSVHDNPRVRQPDPLLGDQWGVHPLTHGICSGQYQNNGFSAGVAPAWNVATGGDAPFGDGVTILILDTGCKFDHEDLINTIPGKCNNFPGFCYGLHGTAIAGIAVATKENGLGIAGVANGSYARVSQVCNPNTGECLDQFVQPELVNALGDFTVDGSPQVINMSYSGQAYPPPTLLGAYRDCALAGQFLAGATGNYYEAGPPPPPQPEYPAALNGMVCAVGAAYMTGIRWADHRVGENEYYFLASVWGPWIDLCAPGGRAVVTTGTIDGYWFVDDAHCSTQDIPGMGFGGTSAAVPVISGVASLLMDYQPLVMGEDAQAIMQLTALDIVDQVDLAGLGWDARTGSGVVQADAALGFISPPRQLRHGAIGYLGHEGTLAVVDSLVGYQQRTFKYVPNLASTQTAWCRWYRLQGTASFNMGYTALPNVWTRASGTAGWRDSTVVDNLGDVPWGRVVPNSITSNVAVFETYVYKIVDGPFSQNVLTWFPDTPDHARVAFTSVGPSTINLDVGSNGLGAGGIWLRAANNPARAGVSLIAGGPVGETATIEVYDVTGRLVARLMTSGGADGQRLARWDGNSIRGTRCGPGVYVARTNSNGGVASCRLVLLR